MQLKMRTPSLLFVVAVVMAKIVQGKWVQVRTESSSRLSSNFHPLESEINTIISEKLPPRVDMVEKKSEIITEQSSSKSEEQFDLEDVTPTHKLGSFGIEVDSTNSGAESGGETPETGKSGDKPKRGTGLTPTFTGDGENKSGNNGRKSSWVVPAKTNGTSGITAKDSKITKEPPTGVAGRGDTEFEYNSHKQVSCDPKNKYPYVDEINPMFYYICFEHGKKYFELRLKCIIGVFRAEENKCVFVRPAAPVPIAEDCKYHDQVFSSPNDCRCYYKCSLIPHTDEFLMEQLCRNIC